MSQPAKRLAGAAEAKGLRREPLVDAGGAFAPRQGKNGLKTRFQGAVEEFDTANQQRRNADY